MDHLNADLRQLDLVDIPRQGGPLTGTPGNRSLDNFFERSALKSSVAVASAVGGSLSALRVPIDIFDHPPKLTIIAPATTTIGLVPSPVIGPLITTRPLTIGIAVEGNIFLGAGVSAQAGIYGSSTPELGVFSGGGPGWWFNVGVSIGPTITIIFGPISDFIGVTWGVGVDVAIPNLGPRASGSAMALFAAPPPSFRFIGFAFGAAAGFSALPADITVQMAATSATPLIK